MDILVISPSDVRIDGVSAGSVVDVLANHDPSLTLKLDTPDNGLRSALLAALLARDEAIGADHAAALAAGAEAQAAALAAQQAAHAATLQAQADELAALRATNADQAALIDTLGGTELGRQMARDQQRQSLLDAKAALEAQLAAIDAPSEV